MTHPSPEKLSIILHRVQSRWKQPERRLVESGEIAVFRAIWIASRDEVLGLQNDYDDARRAVASFEDRLPVVRDVMFWTRDPAAGVPFSLFADTLGTTTEELVKQLFQGVSRELLAVVGNKSPFMCPLCMKKK